MKIKTLNARGFSHVIVVVAVVVIFIISGVGYVVASHADSCNPSRLPVSGVSTPTDCAASLVTCTISGLPASPVYKKTIRPKIKLTNTGDKTAKVHVYVSRITYSDTPGVTVVGLEKFSKKIKPSLSSSRSLKGFKVAHATDSAKYVEYRASFAENGNTACSQKTKLPTAPSATPKTTAGLNG